MAISALTGSGLTTRTVQVTGTIDGASASSQYSFDILIADDICELQVIASPTLTD